VETPDPENKPYNGADKPDGPWEWEDSRTGKTVGSWSFDDERHWSRLRKGQNQEAMDYYKERSHAPGVAEGGGLRSQYCSECDGVIPLKYDQRTPAERGKKQKCPHCGAEISSTVRRMFNWVEIDQPPPSDIAPLLPWIFGIMAIFATGLLFWIFG
jgi:hypothetical protein